MSRCPFAARAGEGFLRTMIKITKFGGSSVADAEHFRKIKAIIDADPARRFVVVSACGRRSKAVPAGTPPRSL